MHRFKKLTAFALSAAMMIGSSMTSLATEVDTTAGVGNILDYKIQTQVVPTSLSLAINPNGYAVNVRYTKLADDATYAEGTKYYSLGSDGKYSIVTDIVATGTGANWDDKLEAGLYTATTSNSQIVTFNYGLANKSTVDRKITVSFDVTADSSIEFVDSAAKATNEATTDDGGAKTGEYKIFLQLVPAKAGEAVTTNTYAKATGDYDADAEYYTLSDGTYTLVETNSEDDFDDYYVAATTIGTLIQAKELADVTMQSSTAPITFTAGTGTTSAEVAFKLGKATYSLKSDQFIDFSTTTAQVADKFEITGIGGVSAFTFTGTMNTNTEWAKLTTKTITITPTYRFEDATGLETAVSTGLNQVEAVPANAAPSIAVTEYDMEADTAVTVSYSLGSGTLAADSLTGVEWVEGAPGTNLFGNTTFVTADASAKTFTMTVASINNMIAGTGDTQTIKVTFSDGTEIELTFNDPE